MPITLAPLAARSAPAIPNDEDLDETLALLDANSDQRLIVLGRDSALAAVLTYFLRIERLDIEIAYVAVDRSPASNVYRTGTGAAAAKQAVQGQAFEVPLIRDDLGIALVGRARINAPGGGKLIGEGFVDDTRIFHGKATSILIMPTGELPGLRACAIRSQLRFPKWVAGRAVQIGADAAVVTRDGVRGERETKRSSFYRHTTPWLLVR